MRQIETEKTEIEQRDKMGLATLQRNWESVTERESGLVEIIPFHIFNITGNTKPIKYL